MQLYQPSVTGSLNVSGSLTVDGSITANGSISGTSSFAVNSTLLNGSGSVAFVSTNSFNSYTSSNDATLTSVAGTAVSAVAGVAALASKTGSYTTTSSFNSYTSSNDATVSCVSSTATSALAGVGALAAQTGSYATTGSNTFIGNQTITGSIFGTGSLTINGCITATGQIVAQTINVQQVTSSVVYSCGSNIFGTSIGNTQTFTGSMYITGSSTQFTNDYIGVNCTNIAGRTVVIKATGSRTTPLEVVDNTGVNSIYLSPNSGGTINLISSNYLSGSTYKSLAISARENTGDFVLTNTGIATFACQVCTPQLVVRSGTPNVQISSTNYAGLYKSFFGSLNSAEGILQLGNNGANYILIGNTSAGGYLQFRTNIDADYGYGCGLEALTIYCNTSVCFAGSVKLAGAFASCLGLGTNTSPAKYLHIQGTNNFTQGIRFSEAGGNYPHNIYFGSSDSAACGWGLDFSVATNSTTSATLLSLRGNCAVGIGHTSPTALLHARGMAAADVLYWLEPYTNGYASKLLLSSRSAGDGGMRYGCGGTNDMNIFSYGAMRFNVGTGNVNGNVTCQRMTIDSDGIVSVSCQICAYSFMATANPVAVEYLIVAGGGGGGWDVGGGGGAGGTLTGSTGLLPGTYPVGIGGGGAGSTGNNSARGYSTYAMGLIAVGGGPGGNYSGGAGGSGGSGGGGAGYGATTNAGLGMTGQGYQGGCGINVGGTNSTGGGGGGAAGMGCISANNLNGFACGGPGILSTIIGSTCSFACGGKGGGDNWGGMTNGPSNSGYGGDGAGVPNAGFNGASGVFVIKALNTNSISFSGGLTVTTCTNLGGYNIYVVTAGAGTMTIS